MPALAAADRGRDDRIPDEARVILEKAEQLVLLSVDPDLPKAKPRDDFYGWRVLGKTMVTDAGTRTSAAERPGFPVIGVAVAVLGIAYVIVGWGLRALRSRARTPAIVLAAIGLLGFPIGTLINAYILWLVVSRKGRMVLSSEYASIVEATPHIKYRTSMVVWISLGAIVPLVVVLIGMAVFG